MRHQLKEEIKDNLEANNTQETSKNILEFDVINIKKEKDETNFESNTATAFERVEQHESKKQSSKIKSPISCEICHRRFGRSSTLKIHINTHTRAKVFKCSECNKEFIWKQGLKKHWLQVHKKEKLKPISCEICHKRFGRSSTLKVHINTHTREKLFKCFECNKEFIWNRNLKRHWLQVHKKEKLKTAIENLHQCEHCDKKFRERGHLINHTRVHTGEKPFECSKCGKKYASKGAMKAHMQSHIEKKIKQPFCCEICRKSFGKRSALNAHMNIHTREKLFKCSECNKEYLWKQDLKRHWLRVHKKEKSKAIPCEICHKRFETTSTLKMHMNTHTRENSFKCSECNKEFLWNHVLKRHWLQVHKKEKPKERPHSNSGEVANLSSVESVGEIKFKLNTIKDEKVDVIEIAITECTDTEEKVKPANDGKVSPHLPYNSCFGKTICKEEVIVPDENLN